MGIASSLLDFKPIYGFPWDLFCRPATGAYLANYRLLGVIWLKTDFAADCCCTCRSSMFFRPLNEGATRIRRFGVLPEACFLSTIWGGRQAECSSIFEQAEEDSLSVMSRVEVFFLGLVLGWRFSLRVWLDCWLCCLDARIRGLSWLS